MSKTTSTELATYAATDTNFIAQRRAQMKEEKDAANTRSSRMTLAEGPNRLRILPGRLGQQSPFYEVWLHYIKNPSNPNAKSRPVPCPNKMHNRNCVVCNKVSELYRSDTEAAKVLAKSLKVSNRALCNVVNLADAEKGVQFLELNKTLYEQLLTALDPGDDGYPGEDYTHPTKGFNITIERTGTGPQNTRYSAPKIARTATAIANTEWLSKMHDLSKVITTVDNAAVQAIMEGRQEEAVAQEDDGPVFDATVTGSSLNEELYDDK